MKHQIKMEASRNKSDQVAHHVRTGFENLKFWKKYTVISAPCAMTQNQHELPQPLNYDCFGNPVFRCSNLSEGLVSIKVTLVGHGTLLLVQNFWHSVDMVGT